jgi:SAM-dependent methyltransferase
MTDIKQSVRERYGKIGGSGKAEGGCCAPHRCATDSKAGTACQNPSSEKLGYSTDELSELPDGADLGLGCGNPQAIADLRPGETVLDLGSGGGIDCFLAARQVGETGKVIGVDMTPEMIDRARAGAAKIGLNNVEFRLGEIENLPVADGTVDVILSNCVVNLSPDKPAVFCEAYRVLRPGGRLAISDIVATEPLSEEVRDNIALYLGCVAGAAAVDEIERMLTDIGFGEIRIEISERSREVIGDCVPSRGVENGVASATIRARRR